MPEFLAVIPARGGSTRLKRKNLRCLGGKPLVRIAVECARAVDELREAVVSSDAPDILEEAQCAAQGDPRVTMHRRPAELATSTAGVEPLLALLLAARPWATHVVLLNPTSPLRDPSTIVRCIMAVTNLHYDCVATVAKSRAPHYAWRRDGTTWTPPFPGPSRPRSQDLPEVLIEHGACYISSRAAIEGGALFAGSCYPVVTDEVEAADIDTEADLAKARGLFDVHVTGFGVL